MYPFTCINNYTRHRAHCVACVAMCVCVAVRASGQAAMQSKRLSIGCAYANGQSQRQLWRWRRAVKTILSNFYREK